MHIKTYELLIEVSLESMVQGTSIMTLSLQFNRQNLKILTRPIMLICRANNNNLL